MRTIRIWKENLDADVSVFRTIVQTEQTHKNAIKNGIKLSPAHLNIFKKAARNGAPKANPTNQPFIVSVTNNPGVVLLNPCFSSRTKV